MSPLRVDGDGGIVGVGEPAQQFIDHLSGDEGHVGCADEDDVAATFCGCGQAGGETTERAGAFGLTGHPGDVRGAAVSGAFDTIMDGPQALIGGRALRGQHQNRVASFPHDPGDPAEHRFAVPFQCRFVAAHPLGRATGQDNCAYSLMLHGDS